MASLTPEQLAEKRRYAGETKPSMKRRRNGHDYQKRQMYLITITVEGRRPLLGRVVGDPAVEKGQPDAPRIALSPLGEAVERQWLAISHYHPEVRVLALQIMPDHIHSILFVERQLPQHLGHIIKGFKAATNQDYKRLMGLESGGLAGNPPVNCAATASQLTTPAANTAPAATETQRCSFSRTTGFLWSIGYTDGILGHKGQLQNWLNYLEDNPRRFLIKRMNPELFRVQRNVKVAGCTFSSIGNSLLLSHPVRIQVQCSRRLTSAEIEEKKKYFMNLAQRGAVLVSPSISPGEKAIMRAAFDNGYPLILLQENGFTDLAKPGGARFDACAQGRLLILAPWEHHNQHLVITRNQCMMLNDMARHICEA